MASICAHVSVSFQERSTSRMPSFIGMVGSEPLGFIGTGQ
jgi:hypothetical protein